MVRKDLREGDSVFADGDVVNFTFDEFRDYLLSDYLIHKVFPKSKDVFAAFIASELADRSPIQEGCSRYLFFIAKDKKDATITEILESQAWYKGVYLKCIFELPDRKVEKEDMEKIKRFLLNDENARPEIIGNLIHRNNLDAYPSLNINFLIEVIEDLDDNRLDKVLSKAFSTARYRFDAINIDRLLESLDNLLGDKPIPDEKPVHNMFGLLPFLFSTSAKYEVKNVYANYFYLHPIKATGQIQRAMNSKSEGLKRENQMFLERYESSLRFL